MPFKRTSGGLEAETDVLVPALGLGGNLLAACCLNAGNRDGIEEGGDRSRTGTEWRSSEIAKEFRQRFPSHRKDAKSKRFQ